MAVVLALGVGVVAAAEQIPLAAFFGPPEIGAVALSPSGTTLLLTVPGKNQRMELVAADMERQPLRFKSLAWLTDYDVANAYWLNDKRLVFDDYDSQAGEWAGVIGLWTIDADGENGRMLIDPYWSGFRAVVPGSRNILPAEWALHSIPRDGGDDVLVVERGWSSFRGAATVGLARLNTHIPRPVHLSTGAPEGAQRWFTNEHGEPQVVEALLDGKRRIYRRGNDSTWQELASFDAAGLAGWVPRFVLDGHLFVASEAPGVPGMQLRLWDTAAGALLPEPILVAKGFDVGSNAEPIVDSLSGQLLGWRYRLDSIYTRWIEPAIAGIQAAVDRALPGRVNVIQCNPCLSAKRLLVVSYSDREPPSYAVLERGTGKLTSIGSAHPDVRAADMGTRSFQRIKARDGRDLPVYLTRPAGAGALPAVLYIHGGPQSRVTLEWNQDSVPQFLASRGYVVVEPEFRGSAGYGIDHQVAGWRQWGLAMQDDMQDALQWAIAQGIVDSSRVCIMGASYGGYAALMGPVRYPEAYRCAISWVAPTDLPELVSDWRSAAGMNKARVRELEARIGTEEQLRETSPINRAAQLRVPVLAAWGVDDQRVPIAHGRSFRDAARAAKVELEYVEYPHEGHVWMNPSNRIDFFGRAEKLLARTLRSP
jgi:dienelactone hydrolase